MKKLVTEIEKNTLIECLPLFGIETQITILDGEKATDNCVGNNPKIKPFYIDENIIDLDKAISMCEFADNSIKSPIRKIKDWDCFWELLLNIQKQREFGQPLSNIEYIYKKGLQLNLPIKLERAGDLGFEPGVDWYVITGNSEIGEMRLYQEDDNFLEYVFELLNFFRIKRFSKKKVQDNTHWHPRGWEMALQDMVAFMNNDKEFFKKHLINLA